MHVVSFVELFLKWKWELMRFKLIIRWTDILCKNLRESLLFHSRFARVVFVGVMFKLLLFRWASECILHLHIHPPFEWKSNKQGIHSFAHNDISNERQLEDARFDCVVFGSVGDTRRRCSASHLRSECLMLLIMYMVIFVEIRFCFHSFSALDEIDRFWQMCVWMEFPSSSDAYGFGYLEWFSGGFRSYLKLNLDSQNTHFHSAIQCKANDSSVLLTRRLRNSFCPLIFARIEQTMAEWDSTARTSLMVNCKFNYNYFEAKWTIN